MPIKPTPRFVKTTSHASPPSSPKPSIRDTAQPKASEFSTGRGFALRRDAAALLGANLFSGGGITRQQGVTGAADPTATTNAQITNSVITGLEGLSAQGQDAAQLTSAAYAMAVEQVRAAYPDMPAAERMDTAVAIATYALNGPGNIANLRTVDSGQTTVVAKLEGIEASGLVAWNNSNLDTTGGGGSLNPVFDDGTNNQAFHTNFFIAGSYVAGTDSARLAILFGGNVAHETLDRDAWANGGGSHADYAASSMGIMIGKELTAARGYAAQSDRGELAYGQDLDLLFPAMTFGGMSVEGTRPPRVAGQSDVQYDASVQMAAAVRGVRDNFLYQVGVENNPLYRLGVLFFQIPPAINGIGNLGG